MMKSFEKEFLDALPLKIANSLVSYNLRELGCFVARFVEEKMEDGSLLKSSTHQSADVNHDLIQSSFQTIKGISDIKTMLKDIEIKMNQLDMTTRYDNNHSTTPLVTIDTIKSLKSDSHSPPLSNIFVHRQLCLNAIDEFEIQQDYKIRARECRHPNGIEECDYHQIGGCSCISALANDWFSEWHKLNEPRLKRCVLVHKTDPKGVQDKNCEYVQQLGAIEFTMACFTWTGGCVWKQTKDEFVYPKYESIGAIHHVVMVTVSPGDSILVDWSIGQFRTKSICDAMLFITV